MGKGLSISRYLSVEAIGDKVEILPPYPWSIPTERLIKCLGRAQLYPNANLYNDLLQKRLLKFH